MLFQVYLLRSCLPVQESVDSERGAYILCCAGLFVRNGYVEKQGVLVFLQGGEREAFLDELQDFVFVL